METTALKLLRGATLVPYILLAGHAFFIRKEALFGFFFLGLQVFNYVLLRKPKYITSRERIIQIMGRLTYAWMFILFFSFLYFRDTPYRYILFGLGLAIPVLFLAWARFSGRWKEVCTLPFLD